MNAIIEKPAIKKPRSPKKTLIRFDLAQVLEPEELEQFSRKANEAGKSITEHFLDLTINLPKRKGFIK